MTRDFDVAAVKGVDVDPETRCTHWHGPFDVVAIRFHCCGDWYACIDCHRELAGHEVTRWPADRWDEPAIGCGACGSSMSIRSYVSSPMCPTCAADFNPRCALHHPLYFERPEG